MDNPIEGVIPDFSIFGAEFTALWQKVLAGLWGLAIICAIVFLLINVASMATASAGSNPVEYKTSRTRALVSGISLGILAALAVIVGAILAVFGS
ncbi:hypothetical protein HL652_21145 (plasmid) [Herbiconiux sp. SALV-R1]|nr:hypothetical protein HL652_21145 [Herbiconiux sp. SALV-R1]